MAKSPSNHSPDEPPASTETRAPQRRNLAGVKAQEDLVRQKLEGTPILRSKSAQDYDLPNVPAPSLEDLAVTVESLPDISEEELVSRFDEELRSVASKRERSIGEEVADNDDVIVDWLAYTEGQLLPFSPRAHVALVARPLPMLPGLGEGLVGMQVGSGGTIQITLPEDYPIQAYRGKEAAFVVDIRSAFEMDVPDPEDPATLELLDRGDSLDEVMESIGAEIEGERADDLFLAAQESVLDEICKRVDVEIPESLINDEIHLQWKETEAPVLQMKNFTVPEQEESLLTWQSDLDTRATAERRIKIGLAFKALIEAENIQPDKEILEMLMAATEESTELERADIKAAMLEDKNATEALTGTAFHMAALEYVMAKAKIQFAEDQFSEGSLESE